MKDVGERVLERFQAATLAVWEPATLAPDEIRLSRRPWKGFFAFAAIALTFAVALSAALWRTSDTSGVARLQDGAIYEAGETFRAINNGSTVITLADGSRVEMRSGGKASVDRASDGLVFHLKSGSIIVNAAKQSAGRHLYVQTNDVTVSVVGTVFFVNAEAEGSRVAVIEVKSTCSKVRWRRGCCRGSKWRRARVWKRVPWVKKFHGVEVPTRTLRFYSNRPKSQVELRRNGWSLKQRPSSCRLRQTAQSGQPVRNVVASMDSSEKERRSLWGDALGIT